MADATLTTLERAAAGPLDGELDRLGPALQAAFGAASTEIAPVLRPYVAHAAGRMNVQPTPFRLAVSAPDAALAAARADALRRAFEGAGLTADKLTVTASAGPPAVTIAR